MDEGNNESVNESIVNFVNAMRTTAIAKVITGAAAEAGSMAVKETWQI